MCFTLSKGEVVVGDGLSRINRDMSRGKARRPPTLARQERTQDTIEWLRESRRSLVALS